MKGKHYFSTVEYNVVFSNNTTPLMVQYSWQSFYCRTRLGVIWGQNYVYASLRWNLLVK